MNRGKSKGFALIYVLAIFALIAAFMVLLPSDSNLLRQETNRLDALAREKNLLASAAAWAQAHGSQAAGEKAIDVSALDIPGAQVTFRPAQPSAERQAALEITWESPYTQAPEQRSLELR